MGYPQLPRRTCTHTHDAGAPAMEQRASRPLVASLLTFNPSTVHDQLVETLNLYSLFHPSQQYMINFVDILRNVLARAPPLVPSPSAVDLLVATAQLQRYLHVRAPRFKQDSTIGV